MPAPAFRPILMHGASRRVRREKSMPVITLLNQKGGVGKTSTTHHLAGTLAAGGTARPPPRQRPPGQPVAGILGAGGDRRARSGRRPSPPSTAASSRSPSRSSGPAASPGIDLVPGSKQATDYNVPRPHEAPAEVQACLRTFLADVRERLRPGPDRLPAEPAPVLLGRPGRVRSPDRPAPARGLRGAGARPGAGSRSRWWRTAPIAGSTCSASC